MIKWKAASFFLAVFAPMVLAQAPDMQASAAQGQEHLQEPYYQAGFPALVGQGGFKYWDKGNLITWAFNGTLQVLRNKPAVVLYDSNGHDREAYIWLDGATTVSVSDATVNKSGKLIVSGGTSNQQDVVASFIAEIGETGRIKRVIQTSPFMPVYNCAAENGTVWSYGIDRDENGNGVWTSPMIRHFSFESGQLKGLLYAKDLNPDWTSLRGRYPGEVTLRCNKNGLVIYNGQSSELVQVDFFDDAVTVTKVAPLPPIDHFRISGFAFTESGNIFATFHERGKQQPKSGLFKMVFDGAGGAKWTQVAGTVGPYLRGSPIERLMGAEGDDLVHTRAVDGKMYWSKYSK